MRRRTEEDYYIYKYKNGKTYEGIMFYDRDSAIKCKGENDLVVCHVEKYQYFDEKGVFVREETITQRDDETYVKVKEKGGYTHEN